MIELLERFTAVVLNEPHLKPVLPSRPIYVCFQSGYDLLFLEISSTHCKVYKGGQEKTDLWLTGDEETIRRLITGEERIRKLETRNELKILGKLKDILMVEALFTLCEKRISA
jgi:hypothetical protein